METDSALKQHGGVAWLQRLDDRLENTLVEEPAWSSSTVMALVTVSFLVVLAHAFNICGRQIAEVSQTSGGGQTEIMFFQFASRGEKKELLHLSGMFYH